MYMLTKSAHPYFAQVLNPQSWSMNLGSAGTSFAGASRNRNAQIPKRCADWGPRLIRGHTSYRLWGAQCPKNGPKIFFGLLFRGAWKMVKKSSGAFWCFLALARKHFENTFEILKNTPGQAPEYFLSISNLFSKYFRANAKKKQKAPDDFLTIF